MGYIEHALGKAGEVALYGLAGTAMVDTLARGFGMKDGVAVPLAKKGINQMASTFGFEEPFSSKVNESDNKGTNINGSQPTNGSESQQNKSVHEKTPSSILDQHGNPIDENHPLKAQTHQPKSEGIISETEEMFKSPKMEKHAGLGFDASVKKLEDMGMSQDGAVATAGILAGGGAAITAAGIMEYSTRFKNSLMGNRTATKDFSYATGNVDKDGKPVMKPVKKGEHFSTKSNAALANYVKNNKDVSVAERGLPSKAIDAFRSRGRTDAPFDISNSTLDETKDVSPGSQDTDTEQSKNGKKNNKINHVNPLNKDNPIVAKKEENFKNAQAKYDASTAKVEAIQNANPIALAKDEMKGIIDTHLADPSLPKDERTKLTKLRAEATGGAKVKKSIASILSQGVKLPNSATGLMGAATKGAGSLAFAQSAGKTGNDLNKVANAGGSDGFIKGMEQSGITEGTKMKKSVALSENQSAKQKILDNELNAAQKEEKADPVNNKGLVNKVKKGMVSDGVAKEVNGKIVATNNADAWVRGRAAASANNATMEDAVTFGGMTYDEHYNSKGKGTSIGRVGHSAVSDNGTTTTIGNKYNANVDGKIYKDSQDKQKFEETKENANIPNDALRLVSKGRDAVHDFFKNTVGMDEKNANLATGVTMGATGATAVAEVGSVFNNWRKGQFRTQKTDSTGNKLYTDEKTGNQVKSDKEGNYFTEDKKGNIKSWEGAESDLKPQMRVKGGVVSENAISTGKKLKQATDKFRGVVNKTGDDTDKGSNPHNETESQQPANDGVDKPHNDSFNKDNPIVPNNREKFNTKSEIISAIDKQSKANEEKAMSDKITGKQFAANEMKLEDLKKNAQDGMVHTKALKEAGVDVKDLGLSTDSKGFVDMDATNAKHAKVAEKMENLEAKKALFKDGENIAKDAVHIPSGGKAGLVAKVIAGSAFVAASTSAFADDGSSDNPKNNSTLDAAKTFSMNIFGQKPTNTFTQNATNAADSTVGMFDPTLFGWETVKGTAHAVSKDIKQGNYGSAVLDVLKTPVNFAKNLKNDSLGFGHMLREEYEKHESEKSVTDSMPTEQGSPILSQNRNSSIPSSAQNAFHSTTGSNTLQAIQKDVNRSSANSSSVDENGIVSINPGTTQGTPTPQGQANVNIDANAIGQNIANSLSNINASVAPVHMQQAISGGANTTTSNAFDDNDSAIAVKGLEGKALGLKELPKYNAFGNNSPELQKQFNGFVQKTEKNKATAVNTLAETATELGEFGAPLVAGAVLDRFTGGYGARAAKSLGKGLWNKTADLRNSFSGNKSTNNSHDYGDGKDGDAINEKTLNNKHNKTPRTTNYAGQPTENHPINQSDSKGILSKFGEMFKSPKMEKLSEIAPKFFDKKNDL